MPVCFGYLESYEETKKNCTPTLFFIAGPLDFHFLFMSLKSPGFKSVSHLLLGNELSIANMKTAHICEVIYDKFELQGIFTGVLSSSQE